MDKRTKRKAKTVSVKPNTSGTDHCTTLDDTEEHDSNSNSDRKRRYPKRQATKLQCLVGRKSVVARPSERRRGKRESNKEKNGSKPDTPKNNRQRKKKVSNGNNRKDKRSKRGTVSASEEEEEKLQNEGDDDAKKENEKEEEKEEEENGKERCKHRGEEETLKKDKKKKRRTEQDVKGDERWNQRIEELKAFKKQFGHLKVPHNFKNKQLYTWVTSVLYKMSVGTPLHPERQRQLLEIGLKKREGKRKDRSTAEEKEKEVKEEEEKEEEEEEEETEEKVEEGAEEREEQQKEDEELNGSDGPQTKKETIDRNSVIRDDKGRGSSKVRISYLLLTSYASFMSDVLLLCTPEEKENSKSFMFA